MQFQPDAPRLLSYIHLSVPGPKVRKESLEGERDRGGTTHATAAIERELFDSARLLKVAFGDERTDETLQIGIQLGLDANGKPTAAKVRLPPSIPMI